MKQTKGVIYTQAEANERGVPTCYGYDGNGYNIGDRVELHPGTDLWARGARFGEVVGLSLTREDRVRVRLDKLPGRLLSCAADMLRIAQ